MQNNKRLAHLLNGIGILLVLLVIFAVLPLSLPKLAGIRAFGILSGSMEPEYAVGGVVYVKPCDVGELQPGDVITYELGSGTACVMTHRIVSVDSQTGAFRTKGDANNSVDPEPVHPERIVGQVIFYLPRLGLVASLLRKPEGIAVVAITLILAVICWMLADIVKRRKKDMVRPAVRIFSVMLMVGAGCHLGRTFRQYQSGESEYGRLKQQVFEETGAADTVAPQAGSTPAEHQSVTDTYSEAQGQDEAIQNAVARLMQDNGDLTGWIAFDTLDISYPVMQGEDNEYYLHHTFSGEKNSAGSIFMDVINHDNWEDAHTIIYGHNMKNLSMFGNLRYYKTKDFYEGNEFFSVHTDKETYRYQIFSYYDVPEVSDVYTVWYTPDENFEEAIREMVQRSDYDTGVEVNAEDKVLTLSTCSTEGNRFVLHAKRVK